MHLTGMPRLALDTAYKPCYNDKAGSEGRTFDRNAMLDKTAG